MGKKGKKKDGEKKEKPVPDGLLPIDMSRKQLLGHAVRLKVFCVELQIQDNCVVQSATRFSIRFSYFLAWQDELDREREERNFFMLEREKLYQRWNLFMEQIAIEKAKVRALKSHLADV